MVPDKTLNLLVRMPNWLGDCVMAMPALRHLTETLPGAKIVLAGRKAFRGVLAAQPGVAGYLEAPESGLGPLLRGLSDTRVIVRRSGLADGIDIGVLFTNSLSTAAWLWRTGAKARIGYDLDCRRFFLTHPVPCGRVEQSWHFTRYYLWLAMMAESVAEEAEEVPPREVSPLGEFLMPSFRVSDSAREAADGILRAAGGERPYAVLAPASAYGAVKDWPPGYYRRLIEMLRRDYSLASVLTGGAGQLGVCAEIADGLPGAVNLAGKTRLDEFAALVAGASLFVGGDSGGAHVAAALGTPTLVIFGITNPARTRPTGPRVRLVGAGEGRDVKLNTPAAREAARLALAGITPDTVMAAVGKLMRG